MEGGTGYLVAGYALTWSVLIWYALRVVRRSERARRDLEEEAGEGSDRDDSGRAGVA